MSGLSNLWAKLTRSKEYRDAFVSSQLKRGIPSQLRVILKRRGWNQGDLAEHSNLTQGAISRACDPDYGNLTFNNVLKIAAGLDVAFVGKFVPFSDLAKWYDNLSEDALDVVAFEDDSIKEKADQKAPTAVHELTIAPLQWATGIYSPISEPRHKQPTEITLSAVARRPPARETKSLQNRWEMYR